MNTDINFPAWDSPLVRAQLEDWARLLRMTPEERVVELRRQVDVNQQRLTNGNTGATPATVP